MDIPGTGDATQHSTSALGSAEVVYSHGGFEAGGSSSGQPSSSLLSACRKAVTEQRFHAGISNKVLLAKARALARSRDSC